MSAERRRLKDDAARTKNWKRWGPYLAERQWGTVREDYSASGDVWGYFTHDMARSRVYRWGEDGLLGFCDRECRLCFSVALWNGVDPILKERLFGLTGPEGNHGEDVKEYYYYLDSTPTHSYWRGLYKYPQQMFPYEWLVRENGRRGRSEPELELIDTGVFAENTYWDVTAEYAKDSPNSLLIRLTVANRAAQVANLHLLPTLWYRNSWAHGCTHEGCEVKPRLMQIAPDEVQGQQASLGEYHWLVGPGPDGEQPPLLFTDNENNSERLWGVANVTPFVKDAFHDFVVHGRAEAVNPRLFGTKAAAHYQLTIAPGDETTVEMRLFAADEAPKIKGFGRPFTSTFTKRQNEANAFYADLAPPELDRDKSLVVRQAYAGLLSSKQFYHYSVKDWLDGDLLQPVPPAERKVGRNHDWPHLFNRDLISMPDKWEYPWYAAWDLAFHMLPMAKVDPHFAKEQLVLLLREWYMHPNGQIPAYEFAFGDVNPPVHAWAAWRVYKMTGPRGKRDTTFLERVFLKLLLNFTWWVNRKDVEGKHLFAGGFLGLDNIGVFDRSRPLPTGGHLQQADGTAWMAFYCVTMLAMALELARNKPSYEDMASKFFEHFVDIADAMNTLGGSGLWDDTDGFYYDQLHTNGDAMPLKVRSLVGIIPLFAVTVLEDDVIDELPGFKRRMEWFLKHRPDLAQHVAYCQTDRPAEKPHTRRLLAIPSRKRLMRMLRYVLDESEFLSPYGVRSVSRYHRDHPFSLWVAGEEHRVEYVPGESNSSMFGGNSNWRGPIWFPLNFLLVEALERYHHFYGDELRVECPVGSGKWLNLAEVACELATRLGRIFLPNASGHRPVHGDFEHYATDPHWRDLVLFYEYFHGEDGSGIGASHQTGWTALVANLLADSARGPQ